jgi:hypothetical protein
MIGWLLYAISFFLPVYEEHVDSGWDAFWIALEAHWYGFTSALTNLIMLLTPFAFFRRRLRLRISVLMLLIAATLLDSWWFFGYGDDRHDLMIGYYVWWASFAVVAMSLALRTRELRAVRERRV